MGLNYDDYEILDTIGVGTVGTIQRVRQKATDKFFALKLLSPAVSNDDLIVARFHREIMVLSKLKHPNIVAYYGEGQHDGQIFYLMEYIRGGTVKDLLSTSGGLGWLEVAECGRQLASALQHAHNHGIIHRDIKPGNIFLTLDGVSKLGDFGIARDMKSPEITDAGTDSWNVCVYGSGIDSRGTIHHRRSRSVRAWLSVVRNVGRSHTILGRQFRATIRTTSARRTTSSARLSRGLSDGVRRTNQQPAKESS